MKPVIASLVCLLLSAASLFAQQPGDPIPLTIRPANLTQPSLKYRLLPDRGQLTEGNAPTQYYRAMSMFMENAGLLAELRGDYWETWLAMPIKDLPRKEVNEKVQMTRYVLRELEVGSKRKQCDWQLEGRSEGFGLLLPDVQGFRVLTRPLAARARLQIAQGNYAAACDTLQIGFAVAHHLGRGPTLIHTLVGMAIARIMLDQVETLLQQPDAPNLYWSLTVMPKPFADLKPALQEEMNFFDNMFPILKKLDATPMSEEQVKAFEAKLAALRQEFGLRKPSMGDRLKQAFVLTQATAEAKAALVEKYQFTPEAVAAMPSFQVAALYAYRDYKEALEEVIKWANVPEPWKYSEYKTQQQRYGKAVKRLDELYFGGLLRALGDSNQFPLENVSLAATRVDRRLAALRCIEAIRQYAAGHDGKMPVALADVKELPIPNDPLTGKPFAYAMEGDKATLSLAKPTEENPNPRQLLIYHLTMARPKE